MVTYSDLFTFVIMLCAVITLVIYIKRKKQRPRSGKVRRYFLQYAICRRLGVLQPLALLSSILYTMEPFFTTTILKNRPVLPAPNGFRYIPEGYNQVCKPTMIVSSPGAACKRFFAGCYFCTQKVLPFDTSQRGVGASVGKIISQKAFW